MPTTTFINNTNESYLERSATRKAWATPTLSILAVDESTQASCGPCNDGLSGS